MERRDFMLAAGAAIACAGASPVLALAAGSARGRLGRATFAGLVRQTLIAYDSARGVALTLVEVKDGKPAPGLEQFSLLLSGSEASPLKGGNYDVYHDSIGTVPLFIEPAGKRGQETLYRIQFSLAG